MRFLHHQSSLLAVLLLLALASCHNPAPPSQTVDFKPTDQETPSDSLVRKPLRSESLSLAPPPAPANKNQTAPRAVWEMDWVEVKGGKYIMGCWDEEDPDCDEDERPGQVVQLDDYLIAAYEVTQAQWQAVMGNNPSHFKDCPQCPVEQVSWDEVQVFISKLNQLTGQKHRLPTEAEWEYAARGGHKAPKKTTRFAGHSNLEQVAWFEDNSQDKTQPVGQKLPNALGLYDMNGNVWEWCQDWKGPYLEDPLFNPKGPDTGQLRVIRGGSWLNRPRSCRISDRAYDPPKRKADNLGFRLVKTL